MPREIVYRGNKIQVALDTAVAADGSAIRRDVILHPGAVAILPVLDADHVCLLRNRREVVGQVLWEIPAGTLDPNEPPDLAAARELAEETGYTAGAWRKLGSFYPSPGVLNERTHLYVATDLTPGVQRLEKDEDLQPHTVAWADALRWALDGTICDAKSLVALLMWERLNGPRG